MTYTTKTAIAYLKTVVPENDTAPVLTLSENDSPVLKDIGNGLLVAYLIDAGDSFAYIQHRHLDRDGVTEEEMHNIGVDNLLALATENELHVVQHGNFYCVILDGHFEASLLLVDSLWRESFRQYVTGDYLVAIPNRDILAFCERSSLAGRVELLDVIGRLQGSVDHPLSRDLFVRRDAEWFIDAMT